MRFPPPRNQVFPAPSPAGAESPLRAGVWGLPARRGLVHLQWSLPASETLARERLDEPALRRAVGRLNESKLIRLRWLGAALWGAVLAFPILVILLLGAPVAVCVAVVVLNWCIICAVMLVYATQRALHGHGQRFLVAELPDLSLDPRWVVRLELDDSRLCAHDWPPFAGDGEERARGRLSCGAGEPQLLLIRVLAATRASAPLYEVQSLTHSLSELSGREQDERSVPERSSTFPESVDGVSLTMSASTPHARLAWPERASSCSSSYSSSCSSSMSVCGAPSASSVAECIVSISAS